MGCPTLQVLRARQAAGLPTFACFLDACKAYDSVPHAALLARLAHKETLET
jgi:hypothetical protein